MAVQLLNPENSPLFKIPKSIQSHKQQRRRRNSSINSNKRLRTTRRVCFSESDSISYSTEKPITVEEKESLWYTINEEIQMKTEAKLLAGKCRLMLETQNAVPSSSSSSNKKRKLSHDVHQNSSSTSLSPITIQECIDESRGLERLIFRQRQYHKELNEKTIIKCQESIKRKIDIETKMGDPRLEILKELAPIKLGLISAKYSKWSRDVALATGRFDFEDRL